MLQMSGIPPFISSLNLTLYRGLDVVRNRIKGFAQKKVTLPPGRHKIVILDEADRSVPMSIRLIKV
jgi:DNA polymerase III delta prime subunit